MTTEAQRQAAFDRSMARARADAAKKRKVTYSDPRRRGGQAIDWVEAERKRSARVRSSGGVSDPKIEEAKRVAAEEAQRQAALKSAEEVKAKAEAEAKAKAEAEAKAKAEAEKKAKAEAEAKKLEEQKKFIITKKKIELEKQRAPQTYDPRLDAFVSPTYGMGAGGTAQIRIPTPDERVLDTEGIILPKEQKIQIDPRQQRYIESLTSKSKDLEIQPYTGVVKPYGAKDVTWTEPQFGTITDSGAYVERSLIRTLQEREFLQPDISKPTDIIYQELSNSISNEILPKIVNKWQVKANEGEISGAEATKKAQEEVSKEFEKQWNKRSSSPAFVKKVQQSQEFRKEFAEAFDSDVIKKRNMGRLELATDIAIGATPLAVPYFIGKAVYYGAKGADKDIRVAEIDPVTGEMFLPLYPALQPSPETTKAGIYGLVAAASAVGAVKDISKSITKERIKELKDLKWSVTGREVIKEGDDTLLRLKASKGTGYASAEAEIYLPVKATAKGQFKILGGRGRVDVRVVDHLKQIADDPASIVTGSSDFNIFARGKVGDGKITTSLGKIDLSKSGFKTTRGEGYISPDKWQVKSVDITPPKPSKVWDKILEGTGTRVVKPAKVKAEIVPGEKAQDFVFGGLSQEGDDAVQFVSGRLHKVRLSTKETTPIFEATEEGTKLVGFKGGDTGVFRVESAGEIIKKEAGEEAIERGFKTFAGGGKRSSKEFLASLYADDVTAQVVGEQAVPGILGAAERTAVIPTKGPSIVSGRRIVSSLLPDVIEDVKPAIGIKTEEIQISQLEPKISEDILMDSVVLQRQLMGSGIESAQVQEPAIDIGIKQETFTATGLVGGQKLQQGQKVPRKQEPPVIFPQVTMPPVSPIPTKVGKLPPIKLDFDYEKARKVKKQGYNVLIKRQATGVKPYWERLNPSGKAFDRKTALDVGSQTTDKEIPARFKIQKAQEYVSKAQDKIGRIQKTLGKKGKKIKTTVYSQPTSYFNKNRQKFRQFKQKKGMKTKLKDEYIEKSKYRLDKRKEKAQIKLAKKRTPPKINRGKRKTPFGF